MAETVWIEVPFGNRIEQDKHPLNLSSQEVVNLQDLTPNRVRESLALRKTSNIISDIPVGFSGMLRIGEQNRPDGTRVLAAVAKTSATGGIYHLYVKNPTTNAWNMVGGLNLGTEGADLSISPEVIRASGEDGKAVVLKLKTLPYEEGGNAVMPRMFHRTNGNQLINRYGIGYVAWNGEVVNFGTEPDGGYAEDFILITVTPVSVNPDSAGSWFGDNDTAYYFYTLVYEGGQESPPIRAAVQANVTTNQWNRVEVRVLTRDNFPPAVKAINIYRKVVDQTAIHNRSADTAVLIQTCPIYNDNEDYRDWDITSQPQSAIYRAKSGTAFFIDKNAVIGGTYFDRQQLAHDVDYISPNSKRQAIFQDRRIIWQLVEKDGSINRNVFGYSHTNGIGVPCYDIVPPANRIPVPFNILGIVSVRSHRIIIGDSKYSIGYFGGSIERWTIYEGETEIGCMAEDSIADTPFGAAYVGYDGIYLVSGFDISQPYARGIIKSTSETHDWAQSKAVYAQNEQEYVILVPHSSESRGDPLILAVSFRTGATRLITPPSPDVSAIGVDSSGFVLLGTNRGVYRLEYGDSEPTGNNPEDSKTPIVELGYRRFFGGSEYQHITKVAVHGSCSPGQFKVTLTGYPSGTEAVVMVGKGGSDEFRSSDNPGASSPDYAHQIKIEYDPANNERPAAFQIDRIFVRGKNVEKRLLP